MQAKHKEIYKKIQSSRIYQHLVWDILFSRLTQTSLGSACQTSMGPHNFTTTPEWSFYFLKYLTSRRPHILTIAQDFRVSQKKSIIRFLQYILDYTSHEHGEENQTKIICQIMDNNNYVIVKLELQLKGTLSRK